MDPTEEELATINTVQDAMDWAGVEDDLAQNLQEALGTVNRVREVALCGTHSLQGRSGARRWTRSRCRTTWTRTWLALQMSGDSDLRRVCLIRVGKTPDERGCGQAQPVVAPHGAFLQQEHKGRPVGHHSIQPPQELKLSAVLDPTLDAEIIPLTKEEMATMYQDYRNKYGDHPSSDSDPSADQLAALRQVVASGSVPFACFTTWGPHGQRLLRKQTFTSYQREWSRKELPGPASFHQWYRSWRVYRTALLLLDACDPERLDCYAETIRGFVTQFGEEVWFLVAKADAEMRSKQLEKLRRQLRVSPAHGFSEASPWSACYAAAAKDHEFWSRELNTPATLFLARHKREGPQVKTEDRASPKRPRQGRAPRRGHTGDDKSEKDDQGTFLKNRRGTEICKNYNLGKCGSAAAPGKCKAKRAHQCQCNRCMGPHQALACPGKGKTD